MDFEDATIDASNGYVPRHSDKPMTVQPNSTALGAGVVQYRRGRDRPAARWIPFQVSTSTSAASASITASSPSAPGN